MHDLLFFQRRYPVVSRFRFKSCHSDWIRSRLKNDSKFRESHLPARKMFSLRRFFFDTNLTQLPITCDQQGTDEMRDEVHSSVGAHTHTNGYQVYDLEEADPQ